MNITSNQQEGWGSSYSGAQADFRVIDGPGTSATFEATTTHEFKADNDTGNGHNGIFIKYRLTIMRQEGNHNPVQVDFVDVSTSFNINNGAEYDYVDLRNREPNPQDNVLTLSVDMIDGSAYWCEAYTNLQIVGNNLKSEDETTRVHS